MKIVGITDAPLDIMGTLFLRITITNGINTSNQTAYISSILLITDSHEGLGYHREISEQYIRGNEVVRRM